MPTYLPPAPVGNPIDGFAWQEWFNQVTRILSNVGIADVILGLSSTGLVTRTGTDTYTVRTLTAPAAGITVTNGNGVSGNPTLALANDLSALEGLASTGIAVRSAADTWVQRTLTGPAAGITVTNGNGVSGNPTLALANDLLALEGLGSTGFAVRSAADTWVQRSLTAPAAGITISDNDGVAGNPTFALANDLSALEGLGSTGLAARTGADAWAQRTITGTANQIAVSNGDGASGNPTLTLSVGDILSGTYTPTLTNVTNLAASTAYQCQYMRVGTTVLVSGKADVDPTAAATTRLGISLPIASNLGAVEDLAGTAFAPAVAGQGAAIGGDAANDRAIMEWVAVDVANRAMFFTFMYEVI